MSSYFTVAQLLLFYPLPFLLHRQKHTVYTVELFCHQVGDELSIRVEKRKKKSTVTHYSSLTHAWGEGNLIWQDHCAKSPFFHVLIWPVVRIYSCCTLGMVHQGIYTKLYTQEGGRFGRGFFVSPRKLKVSLTVSNLPTLTTPFAFN